ncbi:hypothetical protein ACFL1X_02720 [Candidatus Hydrogenedentota bacterium]
MKRVKPIKKKEGRLQPALLIGAVAAITGGAFLYTATQRSSRDLDAEMARLKASGAKITAEDFKNVSIDTNPKGITPESTTGLPGKNAADFYTNLTDDNPFTDDKPESLKEFNKLYTEIDPRIFSEWAAQEERLRAVLESNKELIEEIIQAGLSRYENEIDMEDLFMTPLPHLGNMRSCSRLLWAEVILAMIDEDPDRALEYCGYILNMGNQLKDEPTLTSQHTRIGMSWYVLKSLENISGEISDEAYGNFQSLLDESDNRGSFVLGAEGYRFVGMTLFEKMNKGELGIKDLTQLSHTRIDPIKIYSTPIFAHWRNKDQLAYLNLMNKLVETSKLPYYQAIEEIEKWEEDIKYVVYDNLGPDFLRGDMPDHYPVSSMILHGIDTSLIAQADHEMKIALAKTGLSLAKYKQDNGEYPDSLNALIPNYISSMPIDVYSGNALKYRREDGGFLLYSISNDLVDGNGQPKKYIDGEWVGDIVWRME